MSTVLHEDLVQGSGVLKRRCSSRLSPRMAFKGSRIAKSVPFGLADRQMSKREFGSSWLASRKLKPAGSGVWSLR